MKFKDKQLYYHYCDHNNTESWNQWEAIQPGKQGKKKISFSSQFISTFQKYRFCIPRCIL